MAENQEPDVARRLGGGANRQGVSGSGEAVAEKLKGAFKAVAEYAEKAHKSLTDMEKIVDRIDKKTRSSQSFGSQTGGGNAGGPRFSSQGGGNAGGPRFGGGGGGGLALGLAGFGGGGGGGGRGSATGGAGQGGLGGNAPGGAVDGSMPGGNMLTGALGKMGTAGAVGAAAFKLAAGYGSAHLQDAATMELASSRLNISGGSGSNREYWRGAGSGLARMGGYDLNDNTAAALTLSNQGVLATGGQGIFGQYQGQVQQMTNQFGGMGAASAAQFVGQSRNTNTIFAGRQIGISTTGPGGVALSHDQIARNILKQYRGKSAVGSAQYQKEISAAMDQGAGIDQRINALGYSGEQADALRQDISLLSQGKDPTKDGPGNKLDSQTKDTAQSQMETTSQTAKQLADGAADIKHAGEMFRDAVNKLLRGSKLGGALGWASGAASQVGGPHSSAAGIAPVRFRSNSQVGGPDDTGYLGIEEAVTKLGIKFGTPSKGQTTGGGHASNSEHYQGRAVDFGDATSNPGQIAQALLKYATGANAPIDELIFSPLNIGMKNGVNIGEKGYGASTWAEHRNHVHVGVRPGVKLADVIGGAGGTTTASGGTTGGSAKDDKSSGAATSPGIVNSAGDLIPEGATGSLLGAAPAAASAAKSSSTADASSGDATTSGSSATGDMLSNAKTVIGVAKEMNVGKQGALIGLMTALAESGLINLHGGDRDSQGLFQQRPSQGWGTVAQVTNPHYAAQKFFQALQAENGWQKMDPWVAAQGVQHSGTSSGSNYHAKLAQAQGILNQIGYAQGSWEIERDQYARIHAGEMVVPADDAEQIRRASGGRGTGAPVTIHVTVANASEPEVMRLVQRVKTEMQRDSVLDMIGAS